MKKAWSKWKQFSKKVGTGQINFVFSILFFLIISPAGVLINYFSDFLKTKRFPQWEDVVETYNTIPKLKDQ